MPHMLHRKISTNKSQQPKNMTLCKHPERQHTYVYHNGTNKPDLASYSKIVVGRARFELATFRLSVERSSRAELPAHTSP